jgi:transposase
MNDREQRGLALAALYRIDRDGDKFLVPSQKGNGTKYTVDPNPDHPSCTCPDFTDKGVKCKHLFAVEFVQTREQAPDGAVTVTRTIKVTERVTYKQVWPAYNKAQTQEKHRFQALLHDICRGIPEPKRPAGIGGRKPIPLSDLVFSATYKVYSTVSARRFTCDLQDAAAKGYLSKAGQFNSVLRCLEDPILTPILKGLIVESSKPLAAVETCFAGDSTGFSTSRFVKWFDIKYGQTMQEREWVKVHCACGVKTNVVTAVEILGKNAGDAPQLPALIRQTRENFTIKEWSGDSAYASTENFNELAEAGATPYIAFKDNTTGAVGGLFQKAFNYYKAFHEDFRKHYHKRSNAESTFSMIKAKFGDAIRSKTDVAMANEALCKILCHNICCLIQSMFELGIEATFWAKDEAETATAAEIATADEAIEAMAWM